MTLQSSASPGDPLYMSEVETELGLSATIYLDQSQVRTLFGVSSGTTIYLLDGLGKSNVTWSRPNNTNLSTALKPACDTTTGTSIDTTTSGYVSYVTAITFLLGDSNSYFTPTITNINGRTLKIRAWYDSNEFGTLDSPSGCPVPTFAYSQDGGSTWSSEISLSLTATTYSYVLSATNNPSSSVQVRYTNTMVSGGNTRLGTDYNAESTIYISDQVIV
jgi:hypothetical protein